MEHPRPMPGCSLVGLTVRAVLDAYEIKRDHPTSSKSVKQRCSLLGEAGAEGRVRNDAKTPLTPYVDLAAALLRGAG